MSASADFLQGLLASLDGYPFARWNFPACIGSSLPSSAGFGTGVVVRYGFLESAPDDYAWGQSFGAFDPGYREATERALTTIASYADITFQAAADPRTASIRFGRNSQGSGQAGYAFYPSYAYSYDPSTNILLSATETASAGDVWLNASIFYDAAELNDGGSGLETLLHEIGHAVGLKHPFEGAHILTAPYDSKQYTVMSYTAAPRSSTVTFTATGGGYSYTQSSLAPRSLMVADIAALQHLYGANNNHRTGNDSYRYVNTDLFFETLWDAGGKDTLDCSALSFSCTISLVPGTFSSIGMRTSEASLRQLYAIPNTITISDPGFWASLYNGTNNLAIAYGCQIENCLGSRRNDRISGNALDNLIDGRGGADLMAGAAGNDTYIVDRAEDRVSEGAGNGVDTIRSSVDLTLPANVENLSLRGTAVRGTGNSLANLLIGNERANLLDGGEGADRLGGGAGADALTGGAGVDVFQYAATGDSGVGAGLRDRISDFEGSGGEKIDLSAIDAFRGAGGNQSFVYIGAAAFSGRQGEVRFSDGILQISTGVDTTTDMEIALSGVSSFRAAFLRL